jgi:hypothetical protein
MTITDGAEPPEIVVDILALTKLRIPVYSNRISTPAVTVIGVVTGAHVLGSIGEFDVSIWMTPAVTPAGVCIRKA